MINKKFQRSLESWWTCATNFLSGLMRAGQTQTQLMLDMLVKVRTKAHVAELRQPSAGQGKQITELEKITAKELWRKYMQDVRAAESDCNNTSRHHDYRKS